MQSASQSDRNTAQSRSLLPSAIGVGIILFYVLFTLLPNSNSLMVKWPWVFIWQFGLMLGPIALLFQLWHQSFRKLGHRLDWLAGAWCLVLVLSAAFSEFSHQAFWYSWAAICGIAVLYALNTWLNSGKKVRILLTFQGGLSVIFSGLSLITWFLQTVRPHLQMLQALKSYGIDRSLELQSIPLRNWHPLGHQNYVAGYLILALPLLIGLAFSQRGWRRVGWLCGFSLSLATLYSTASRAGWLSLILGVAVFLSLSARQYPKLRKTLLASGLTSLGVIALWGFSSDRIRDLFTALLNQGEGGEFFYRAITNTTGWLIGLDHPILGAGLGSVTLLYQKYRPAWAGHEAELTYQLHSTPAQLWAELGLAGSLLTVASLVVIGYLSLRQRPQTQITVQPLTPLPLITGTVSGLAGYSLYAITDYQLDNICISGTLIIFIAVLIIENRQPSISDGQVIDNRSALSHPISKRLVLTGTSLIVAVSIWLYPIHRAWMLSSQGFLALQQKDITSFVSYLERSHRLAPWEPYYPYQLGWNLGELAFQSTDAQQQETLRKKSVQWFEKAIALSPHREFGHSNLGWLLVNSDPHQATENFLQAAQLVPQKKGIFFALGYSLQKEGKTDLARQAMVTELIQHPSLLTSAIWHAPELSSLYPHVLTDFEAALLVQPLDPKASEASSFYRHYTLGGLYWWQGTFDKARTAFAQASTPLTQTLMWLTDTSPRQGSEPPAIENNSLASLFFAWQSLADTTSDDNDSYLMLASTLLHDPELTAMPPVDYLNDIISDVQSSVIASTNFYDWLTKKAPIRQRRNQRLGFGTISRHIDGPIPSDFSLRIENVIVKEFLGATLFPSMPSDMGTDTSFFTHKQDLYRQIEDSVSETSS